MGRRQHNVLLAALGTVALFGGVVAFQPALAATKAAVLEPAESKKTAALALAYLVVSYESTKAGGRIGFQQTFDQTVRADPAVQSMEQETPGFIAFLEGRMLENAMDNIDMMHPILVERVAALFERELSLAHINSVIVFLRTPTGKKILNGGAEGLKLDPEYIACLQSGRQDCASADMIAGANRQSGRSVVATMTVEELQAAYAFQQTDAAKAYFALSPQIAQITADVVNELLPELQARSIGTARTAVADWQDMQKETNSP